MVGPYTRLGANHPGPLMFYALHGPYRWPGSGSEAAAAGGGRARHRRRRSARRRRLPSAARSPFCCWRER
ncbi:MAG: hypothetical protein U5R31_06485 [Acidimicrobiia bacterium]|nr:hypothetical protein [Acidimicrobiia bacterium]